MPLLLKTLMEYLLIDVEVNDSVESVKEKIQDLHGFDFAKGFGLSFGGAVMQDDRTLADYNIKMTESFDDYDAAVLLEYPEGVEGEKE